MGSLAVSYLDWQQTHDIVRYDFTERNPLLSKHPTHGQVNRVFIGCTLLSYYIADKLNSKNRKIYLTLVILAESIAVRHNLSVGLKF